MIIFKKMMIIIIITIIIIIIIIIIIMSTTTTTDSICNQTKGDLTGARICYRKLVCWEQIEIHKKGGRHPIGQNVTSGNEVV